MRSRAGKVHLKTSAQTLRAAGVLLDEPRQDRLDLTELFGNTRPVEVEIGPGKGAFLLSRAAHRPEINFLGIEWVPAHAAYAADRAFRANLKNVRVLCADAAKVFGKLLDDRAVWRVHIFFPDPWPKRRHHARRLLTTGFLRQVYRVLRPGGYLGVVTDHAGYFNYIRTALAAVSGFAVVPFDWAGLADNKAGSNFQRKYAAAGRTFHALAGMKY